MTTENTDTLHTDTDGEAAAESGSIPVMPEVAADEADVQATGQEAEQETVAFELPEKFQGDPRFEGVDSQEALYDALASPRAPEEYSFAEGYDPELTAAMAAQAKAVDMSQEQLDAVLAFQAEQDKAAYESVRAEVLGGVKDLKAEWGEEYEGNVNAANKAISIFDKDGAVSELMKQRPEIAAHPAVAKLFKAVHDAIDVDRFLDSEGVPKQRPTDEHGRAYFASYDKTTGSKE